MPKLGLRYWALLMVVGLMACGESAPVGPGTAPRINSRPFSASTLTTFKFRCVIRTLPYWPANRLR